MVSVGTNIFFRACALIFLGLHFEIYLTNAKRSFVVDEDNSSLENVLRGDIINHPKKVAHFSWPKPKKIPDLAPPFSLGILSKGIRTPPSGLSQGTSNNPPSPHVAPIILHKESMVNFGILPKGVRIPPSGPSRRTSDPPPPLSNFHSIKESRIKYGILPKGVRIPPSGPSKRNSDYYPPPPMHLHAPSII
ncbi:proline-rich protein HaeIII subfamily 1-like [Cucumis melo var. makuwa]|uniref:Proline-rich protein HaeIII subfamily 1-like n=2 Tax=Cucumis melo TaxID=3656 RepID=A0A5D3CGG1_CUCMM|nr:proline-rich protein HaeIII subfamily 1-like [Cucumis melo var. makuwa]TYK10605.1 proline-rich protein HaeIII subfamily 1-like [Cucumis melo var. makuwa]